MKNTTMLGLGATAAFVGLAYTMYNRNAEAQRVREARDEAKKAFAPFAQIAAEAAEEGTKRIARREAKKAFTPFAQIAAEAAKAGENKIVKAVQAAVQAETVVVASTAVKSLKLSGVKF